MEIKPDIRGLSIDDLKEVMVSSGSPSYRADQVYEWLWKKAARSFEEMTNLPKSARKWLKDNYILLPVTIASNQISADGTIKLAFQLHDGHFVEGVLIPTATRMTACVSSQAGCSLSCTFCATGYLEMKRNLSAAEIYDQIVLIRDLAQKTYDKPLTNIVYMGMGEPLLNYKNVLQSIELVTSKKGLDMSPKRTTVSTAGISKMVRRLADDQVRFNLALSLHAADDEKRSKIMPINETNNLEELNKALDYFYSKTGNKVTLEYVMLGDFNSSIEDAKKLLKFARKVPCKINLIEYNPVPVSGFYKCHEKRTEEFAERLERNGMNVNIRRSRGKDIQAACGQLANSKQSC